MSFSDLKGTALFGMERNTFLHWFREEQLSDFVLVKENCTDLNRNSFSFFVLKKK